MTVDSSRVLVEGPWRHEFVPSNGSRFHVAVAGPGDRDTPLVVLLHGVGQCWWTWRHQIPVLAEAGYRVVAMDLRGTGASDKPPLGYDAVTLARDVAGVIRSLGSQRAVVVGHGVGGGLAWTLPAVAPAVVRAVGAVAAPHPLHLRARAPRILSAAAWRLVAFAQLPYFPERSMRQRDLGAHLFESWSAPGFADDGAVDFYRAAARVPFAAHSQLEHVRWLVRSTPRFDGRRYLAALRDAAPVPSLQLHGELDPALRVKHARSDARHVGPAAQYAVVGGAGHFVPEEAPEEVATLLRDWLAVVSPVDQA